MPIWDWKCPQCGYKEECISNKTDDRYCYKCKSKMVTLFPTTMSFKLIYDPKKDKVSWGNEGYAKTRRYEEIDKLAKKNKN